MWINCGRCASPHLLYLVWLPRWSVCRQLIDLFVQWEKLSGETVDHITHFVWSWCINLIVMPVVCFICVFVQTRYTIKMVQLQCQYAFRPVYLRRMSLQLVNHCLRLLVIAWASALWNLNLHNGFTTYCENPYLIPRALVYSVLVNKENKLIREASLASIYCDPEGDTCSSNFSCNSQKRFHIYPDNGWNHMMVSEAPVRQRINWFLWKTY